MAPWRHLVAENVKRELSKPGFSFSARLSSLLDRYCCWAPKKFPSIYIGHDNFFLTCFEASCSSSTTVAARICTVFAQSSGNFCVASPLFMLFSHAHVAHKFFIHARMSLDYNMPSYVLKAIPLFSAFFGLQKNQVTCTAAPISRFRFVYHLQIFFPQTSSKIAMRNDCTKNAIIAPWLQRVTSYAYIGFD